MPHLRAKTVPRVIAKWAANWPLWVKVTSPGVQPASRLYPNSGHGLAPRKLTLCANNGSHWFGVAGSDAGELTRKGGSGGINHQPFRLG
jgi:hypothetical protein